MCVIRYGYTETDDLDIDTKSITFSSNSNVLDRDRGGIFVGKKSIISLLRIHRHYRPSTQAFQYPTEPCPFPHQPLPTSIEATEVLKCWLLP
jgi:hypothetical protein